VSRLCTIGETTGCNGEATGTIAEVIATSGEATCTSEELTCTSEELTATTADVIATTAQLTCTTATMTGCIARCDCHQRRRNGSPCTSYRHQRRGDRAQPSSSSPPPNSRPGRSGETIATNATLIGTTATLIGTSARVIVPVDAAHLPRAGVIVHAHATYRHPTVRNRHRIERRCTCTTAYRVCR
jgi:hypothetical protein